MGVIKPTFACTRHSYHLIGEGWVLIAPEDAYMRLASMLRSSPRQNFGSTTPLFSRYTSRFGESVYPENNGEVLPKLRLGRERNMEANPSTHPRAIQETWTIQKRYRRKYALHTNDRVCLSDGRRLTRLRNLSSTMGKERRRFIPRVAVERG
jgi:hypothetical protein